MPVALAYGLLPLCASAPLLVYWHAWTPTGPTWEQFLQAALYRRFEFTPQGLTPWAVGLALTGWCAELLVLRRIWTVGWGRLLGETVAMVVCFSLALVVLSSPWWLAG